MALCFMNIVFVLGRDVALKFTYVLFCSAAGEGGGQH